jgi:hypothetical protein
MGAWMRFALKDLRGFLIIGIIGFCLMTTLYVSIPDFPRNAYAWEIMLWGESSQWWSEVTWIVMFGVFATSTVFLASWNSELRLSRAIAFYRGVFLGTMLLASALLLFSFSAIFFHWDGWSQTIALDKNGWLHGIFYLFTSLLGIVVFEEVLVFGETVFHSRLRISRTS